MNYRPPAGDGYQQLAELIRRVQEELRTLQRPTGTSINSLVDQVQAALADINTTVATAIAANSYTKAQIDSKVANPGNISPGNVTASGSVSSGGRVTSALPLTSLGSYGFQVSTGYVSAWINNDGQIGFSPSTLATKKDLEPFPAELAAAFLNLDVYLGRYLGDDEDSPLKVFLIAEDVAAAGFGPDVVPTSEEGSPVAINYSQLVVPLLAALKLQDARITALEARA